MRAHVYIYAEGRGYQDQPLAYTSAELYLNCGTYQSGQPLLSGCSCVGIRFIIWLLFTYWSHVLICDRHIYFYKQAYLK